MRLELARSAGFCYGVRRAVQMAEMAAEEGRPCVMLGPIIHNRDVIAYLESIGVGLVDTPEEVPPGTAVLIRSHGEGRPVHEALARLGRPVIDATCPNVSRIHQIVSRAEEGGRQVLIIGTRTHPEVAAIAGWCRRPVVLEGVAELSNWLETAPERRDIPLTMVSQTTSTRFIWDSCVMLRVNDSLRPRRWPRAPMLWSSSEGGRAPIPNGWPSYAGHSVPWSFGSNGRRSWNLPTCVGRLLLESLRARPRLSGL